MSHNAFKRKIKTKSEEARSPNLGSKICPAKAIYVKGILEEPTELVPTHKYPEGEQTEGFRLYNLPTLISGKVSGLCGPNGIGKTTYCLKYYFWKIKTKFWQF
ncbi:MAG: hypothetical protein ACTSPN_10885 [Promethearchaeota archaeon]